MTIYSFWEDQLAGLEPETTPGTPHEGFYFLVRRVTVDDHSRLGRKKRIEHIPETIAIWRDRKDEFVMRIETADGVVRIVNDIDAIDNTFARVCRNAISYDVYQLGPDNIPTKLDKSRTVKESIERSVSYMKRLNNECE